MGEVTLPRTAVREDARLEKLASGAAEELMRHRWHWTLDESNPKRVSIRAYALAVGKQHSTIGNYANGYLLMVDEHGRRTTTTPDEARKRANMGAETEAAASAVAKARKQTLGNVTKTRHTEVRRVRQVARERAEKNETTVEEEAEKVADWIVKSEQAEQQQTRQRKQKLGLRYVELEGKLDRMKKIGAEVLNLAHDVDFGEEEMELLRHTLESIKALINLIDLRLAGAANIDWDAELAKLAPEEDVA